MNVATLYKKYLNDSGLSYCSIQKYYEQVPTNYEVIIILKKYTGCTNLFDVGDIAALEKVKEEVELLPIDNSGNNMYSYGIAKYISFLKLSTFDIVKLL